MKLKAIYKLLTILQCIALSQHSHVQEVKQRIRTEVRSVVGEYKQIPTVSSSAHHQQHHQHHHHLHHQRHSQRQQHVHHQRRPKQHHHQHIYRWQGVPHWSGRRRHSMEHYHFSSWSSWSPCSEACVQQRERLCKIKRKCGHMRHVEERPCHDCHMRPVHWPTVGPPHSQLEYLPAIHTATNAASSTAQPAIVINSPGVIIETAGPTTHPHSDESIDHSVIGESPKIHHYNLRSHASEGNDFYILKNHKKSRRKKISFSKYQDEIHHRPHANFDYDWKAVDDEDDTTVLKNYERIKHKQKSLRQQRHYGDDEGDVFQYEDFDFEPDRQDSNQESSDSYEDNDYAEPRNNGSYSWEKATPDSMIPRHRRIYSKWSRWTKCSPKCTTRRYKKCRMREHCGREVLREIAYCYTEGSFCQQWLQAQVQKSPPYELRPVAASRRRDITSNGDIQSNSIVNDYIMHGKGYRGPEYAPMKLKCGINSLRSNKRNMYNMLKIIGGKASRKGEWPWQVAIFNRFKEAFCGGTLIAPNWVLTAAHCVRKVLYVRFGEHNLDYEDGTEIQLRVLRSYKHPNFDKKTVDSDVALLRLPKPVNTTTWIGFSCLPKPYQPLPKNMDCTVIGWGKRRSRDQSGTSVLHQADVPIIPMENCRSVYQDYTITKNMFCAGHKKGRIDTCAGDSGGPLMCRDTTKPNHPWTIFGITSFGDGCAKRNKFGIYAKVPNYVDWVWSVVNCNGNCKLS